MARGSVVKRGKSRTIIYYVNGKQTWESVGQVTKKEAEERLRKRMQEIDGGEYVPASNLKATVREFGEHWLKIDVKARRWSTQITYRSRLKHIYHWLRVREPGDLPIVNVTPERLDRLRGELLTTLSPTMAVNVLKMFKRALRMAKKWGYIRYNPALDFEQPSIPGSDFTAPEKEEFHALCDELQRPVYEPDAYALTFTAVLTGLRPGEIIALAWDDLDLDRGRALVRHTYSASRLTAPKTKSGHRTVILPPSVVDLLRARKLTATGPRVFPGVKGGYRKLDKFGARNLYPALAAVGLPKMTFHKLRHLHATFLGRVPGVDVKTVQANLGHADPMLTLKVYTHESDRTRQEAATGLDALLSRPISNHERGDT